jgi:hypothetical protein
MWTLDIDDETDLALLAMALDVYQIPGKGHSSRRLSRRVSQASLLRARPRTSAASEPFGQGSQVPIPA